MKLLRTALLVVAAIAASPAIAQNVLTFSAETTTGDGVVTPVLTWSTEPAADECTASGAWSGPKAPAGTETLSAITSSQTFNLVCTWTGDDSALLAWVNPTENTNGTPYTDRGMTLILYDVDVADGAPLMFMRPIANPMVTSYRFERAEFEELVGDGADISGTWTFEAYADNARNVSSEPSSRASKMLTGAIEGSESVGITVNPVPGPITSLSVE